MWLQTRMFLLVAVMLGILYGVITGIGIWMGAGSAMLYIVLAFVFLGIQYLISPAIVGWTMRIKWVSEKEEPALHRMELFTTHPNMLKRIKHLSTLTV